jgi:hypothetical protein
MVYIINFSKYLKIQSIIECFLKTLKKRISKTFIVVMKKNKLKINPK